MALSIVANQILAQTYLPQLPLIADSRKAEMDSNLGPVVNELHLSPFLMFHMKHFGHFVALQKSKIDCSYLLAAIKNKTDVIG